MFWRGVLGYLPVNIVQGVVGLLTIVVFTRVLDPHQYGDYALALSVVMVVHTALFTWLEAAMARFQPAEAASGSIPDHFATLYRTWAVLAAGLVVVGGLILALWPMAAPLKIALATGLGGTIFKALGRMAQEHRRAAGRVKEAALLDIVVTAGGFAAGAGLAFAGLGGAAPLTGLGLAFMVCLVWVLPSELKLAGGGKLQPERVRAYAHYGLPLAASLILGLFLSTVDRFLIAAFMDSGAVGVYHAGYSLANRTLDVIFIWLGSAAGPAAIAALEFGGRPALDKTAREQSSFMLLIAIPAAVGLALVAQPLADLLVGEALRDGAARVTPWIAASGLFAGVTTYYFHTAFTLAKATRLLLLAMTVPAVANIALNLLLIPPYGLMGAVVATAVSYGLGLVASAVIGRRAIALPIPWSTILRAGAASAVMAAVVSLIPDFGGVLELALKAGAGGLVYGLVALALDAGGARSQGMALLVRLRGKVSPA
jgi:O-antigen/teichoic acid export membrane protein